MYLFKSILATKQKENVATVSKWDSHSPRRNTESDTGSESFSAARPVRASIVYHV